MIKEIIIALFLAVIVYAGIYDLKTHTIPDYIHIIIAFLGILITNNYLQSAAGAVLIPLPFLISALVKNKSIGGGDIKFMFSCGLFLGLYKGFVALITGLFLAVIFNLLFNKRKKNFALIPYLAAGCIVSLII